MVMKACQLSTAKAKHLMVFTDTQIAAVLMIDMKTVHILTRTEVDMLTVACIQDRARGHRHGVAGIRLLEMLLWVQPLALPPWACPNPTTEVAPQESPKAERGHHRLILRIPIFPDRLESLSLGV